MSVRKSPLTIGFLLSVCAWFVSSLPAYGAAAQTAVLWRAPADIASRNLYYGPGGRKDVPRGTFTFVKEDLQGSNPKFVVRDQYGHKWKVKLGIEARPETVASRLVWAVGYSANEDYFVSNLHVQGMPAHLHRGRNLIGPGGWVRNVRLKREDEKKAGHWRWRHDPFTGTRELNGLKVVMALINNWDLKDVNNAIYQDGDAQIYMVSDLGASFGAAGRAWPRQKAKGNLEVYERSRFIRKVTPLDVDFEAPARPSLIYVVNPKEYFSRLRLESIGRNIPREDARWIGDWLARLSPKQILDAFRAADYSPREAAAFAQVIERRIAVLTDL